MPLCNRLKREFLNLALPEFLNLALIIKENRVPSLWNSFGQRQKLGIWEPWDNAPINGLPQDGGGRATHGKFDIFRFSNVNFPTLGSPLKVKFPPLGTTDLHNKLNEMIETHKKFIAALPQTQHWFEQTTIKQDPLKTIQIVFLVAKIF